MHGISRIAGRVVLIALALMLLLFVLHQPERAGQSANHIGAWLSHAGDSIGTFVDSLVH